MVRSLYMGSAIFFIVQPVYGECHVFQSLGEAQHILFLQSTPSHGAQAGQWSYSSIARNAYLECCSDVVQNPW